MMNSSAENTAAVLAEATTWLFVPATRPDRVEKALKSSADVVVVDLEDAVAATQKHEARAALAAFGGNPRVVVRINSEHSMFHKDDVDVVKTSRLAVMIAKCERAETVARLGEECSTPIIPLLETARGLAAAEAIAAHPATCRLAFGSMDFALDIGADPADEAALLLARSRIVYVSASAALPAPVDGITTAVRDAAQTAQDAVRSRRLGFGGKLCIHPDQLRPAATAFLPDEHELRWAHSILSTDASGGSVIGDDFVDPPIRARAERIVALHGRGREITG